jgi:hypothetical protein
MNIPRILAGTIFNLLGALVVYKGIRTTWLKGIAEGFLDIIIGFGFILIGFLVWTGYIS